VNQIITLKYTTTSPKIYPSLITSSAKGGYILVAKLDTKERINVGNLGLIPFPRGFYAYLGSALGGFKSRINRHLTDGKKPKWHIDYLLNKAKISQVIICETQRNLECLLAQALADELTHIPGFGSSDCKCQSHLYFASHMPKLELGIRKAIAQVAFPEEFFKELAGL
jgi:Uri superfamily endonuclease